MDAPANPVTIAAIATAPGRGGVGIVRVSGAPDRVDAIARAVLGQAPPPRVATTATFRGATGEPLDQGLALLFPAPRSYTGETVLELHGHGSPAALALVLARCVDLGARLAEPGEFTKRAYLAGKLDLAQAEGVADLIDAASAGAARAAARSLTGAFSREVQRVVDEVTELRALVEAALDFPDEDVDIVRASDATASLARTRAALERLAARASAGVRLARGLVVVLVGRPNVGKSSLMNRLARDDVAIVTPVPGTTRDTIERAIEVAGIALTLIDTAGLRDTDDPVERLGIDRARAAIARADAVVVLVDARDAGAMPDAESRAILERLPAGLRRIVVRNKADLAGEPPGLSMDGDTPCITLSALAGEGVDLLERELAGLAGAEAAGEDAFTARARHVEALARAAARLAAAAAHLAVRAPPLELYAEELRGAQDALGSITGAVSADDLLGAIFSRFCIGK